MSWTFLWFLITLVEVTYYAFHTFSFHGCANCPCRSMDHLSSPPPNLFRVGYGWRINDHQWKNLLTHLSVRMNSTSTFTSVRICNFFFIKVDDVRAYTFQPQMTSHTGLRNFSGPHPTYSLAWIGMGLDKNMVKNEGTMHKVLLLY